ncbi:MAG: hypothetical protein V4488_04240 [Pseudomonadota bacterium]
MNSLTVMLALLLAAHNPARPATWVSACVPRRLSSLSKLATQ